MGDDADKHKRDLLTTTMCKCELKLVNILSIPKALW